MQDVWFPFDIMLRSIIDWNSISPIHQFLVKVANGICQTVHRESRDSMCAEEFRVDFADDLSESDAVHEEGGRSIDRASEMAVAMFFASTGQLVAIARWQWNVAVKVM